MCSVKKLCLFNRSFSADKRTQTLKANYVDPEWREMSLVRPSGLLRFDRDLFFPMPLLGYNSSENTEGQNSVL